MTSQGWSPLQEEGQGEGGPNGGGAPAGSVAVQLAAEEAKQGAHPPGGFAAAKGEIVALGLLTLPIVVSSVLQMALEVVTVMAVAQLGLEGLDGAGLGRIFANCVGFSPIVGTIMAMETIATQAHGAENLHLVGDTAQRAALIALVLFVPAAGLWCAADRVLVLAGQDPAIAAQAGLYLRGALPGLYPLLLFEVVKRFLQAQSIVYPIPCLLLITLAFHIGVTYLFIWPLRLGFVGGPLALSVSYFVLAAMSIAYVRFGATCFPTACGGENPMRCWRGFSRHALRDWGQFLRLGLPSAAQLCLDWWAFELLLLQAGALGAAELASCSTMMQVVILCFMVSMGLSSATAVRVGAHLGGGAAAAARLACRLAVALMVLLGCTMGAVVLLTEPLWVKAYTEDAQVMALMGRLRWMAAVLIVTDGTQAVMGGAMRGAGFQVWGAGINFLGQWVVTLPLAAAAAFVWGWGVPGLFGALLCGSALLPLLDGLVLGCMDWSRIATMAKERTAHQ